MILLFPVLLICLRLFPSMIQLSASKRNTCIVLLYISALCVDSSDFDIINPLIVLLINLVLLMYFTLMIPALPNCTVLRLLFCSVIFSKTPCPPNIGHILVPL